MKIYIKNMVCQRCRLAVINILNDMALSYNSVQLGVIDFDNYYGQKLPIDVETSLANELQALGFSLLSDKTSMLIESIKLSCFDFLKQIEHTDKKTLSKHITSTVHFEYNYLSQLFSVVEGITIEQYFIRLRVEKVKELLVYNEISISEIAFQLGYSSVAHLSGQFKKVTGLTPGYFRALKNEKLRSPLDKL
tara:strand:- start:1745 stop:2320 length:576 start_codon:yes stop_codon:yes gene_type:complete